MSDISAVMTASSQRCIPCKATPIFAKGRCTACYFFWRRAGRDRTPEELRRRAARRYEDRVRGEEIRILIDRARSEAG